MSHNQEHYLIDKEKYGWVEDPPNYYARLTSATSIWYKRWSTDDEFHRINGPARMWSSGYKEYYLNGKRFSDIKTDEEWIIKQIIE